MLLQTNLLARLIRLPESDTVLLGHIPTLREEFLVRNGLLTLVTRLLHEQLRSQLLLYKLLGLQPHAAVLVGNHLALGLRHVDTDVLGLGLALAAELNMALLSIFQDPLEVQIF